MTIGHCNNCGGERNQSVLHREYKSWSDDEAGISGSDTHEMLKCMGCNSIRLRHTSTFSEDDEPTVTYYPPSVFRKRPEWLAGMALFSPPEEELVAELLGEIYSALQSGQFRLAAMGVRALLEQVMIHKVGDKGSFVKNLNAFEAGGFVSKLERARLETILEAGHATMHRAFKPSARDLIILVDVAEHVIEAIYVHHRPVEELKGRVPGRTSSDAQQAVQGDGPASGGSTP